jgi:type II secretory pathway component GspD/PulD (secretin)
VAIILGRPVIATELSPQDPKPAPQEGDKDFERIQEEQRIRQDRDAVLMKAYLDAARAALAGQDAKKAEENVLQALRLRPNDPEALDVFRQVMAVQGVAISGVEQSIAMVQNRRQLARQQQQMLVNDHYTKATQLEAQRDFDRARVELENAQLIMRFDPYETDFGARKADVDELLGIVRRRLEEQERASESAEYEKAYAKLVEQESAAKRREDEQTRNLLVAAIESFQRGEFDNTEAQANKVLRCQPCNQKARELAECARQARHSQWRASFYEQKRDQFQRWMLDIRAAQIPDPTLLRWAPPDEWEQISKRAERDDLVAKEAALSESLQAIKSKLDNDTVTWDFGETQQTFEDVIKQIRTTTGINIVIDPDVRAEKGQEPVTVTLRDYKLGGALKLLLANLKLAYVLRNDVLYITTEEKALGRPIARIYDVRDLTVSLPHFKAPNLNLRPGGAGEAAVKAIWGEDLERTQDTDLSRLVDLIRENIAPGTWDVEGHSIQPSAGQIVVSTTTEIHGKIDGFLEDLRKFTKLTVHVEARFISIEKGTLQDLGFDWRGLGGTNPGQIALLDDVNNGVPHFASAGTDNSQPGLPAASSLHPSSGAFFNDNSDGDVRARTENIFDNMFGSLLNNIGGATVGFSILNDDLKLGGLIRAVEKNLDATLVNAPRLTIYNRQRANLSIVNQVSYVKDYDVEVAQTAFIADPLVDVVQDGLTLDVKPTVSYDRKYVQLELQPTVATLLRPIRTFETNLSGLTTPVIIELPEVITRSAQTTVTVPDHGFVVIGGLKHVVTRDTRSETPILGQIPIISLFFSRKGRNDEIRDLIIIMHVKIVDLSEEEKNLDSGSPCR